MVRSVALAVLCVVASGCSQILKEGAWRLTVTDADDGCGFGVAPGVDVLADLSWDDDGTLVMDMNGGNVIFADVSGDSLSYFVSQTFPVDSCDLAQDVVGSGTIADPKHFSFTEDIELARDGGQCGSLGIDLPCTTMSVFDAEYEHN